MQDRSMLAAVGRRRGTHGITSGALLRKGGSNPPPSWAGLDLFEDFGASPAVEVPERAAPDLWYPVAPHRGSRNIGARSRRSFRVRLVTPWDQEIRVESMLENRLVLVLLASPFVRDVIEQASPITFIGDDGKEHEHYFDCIAHLVDGSRTAYVAKSMASSIRNDTKRLVDLLAMQLDASVADRVMLVTEADLPHWLVYNATLINSVRLHGPWAGDPSVSVMRAVVDRTMPLAEAVRRGGIEGRGFRAIAHLIGEGALRVARGDIIDYGSVIEPVGAAPAFPQ